MEFKIEPPATDLPERGPASECSDPGDVAVELGDLDEIGLPFDI